MKRIVASLILIFLIAIVSCSAENELYSSSGTITGIDVRECACCGGYFIEIGEVTYRFFNLPDNSKLNLENPTFPIYVNLDWIKDPNACLGDEIIVLNIEER